MMRGIDLGLDLQNPAYYNEVCVQNSLPPEILHLGLVSKVARFDKLEAYHRYVPIEAEWVNVISPIVYKRLDSRLPSCFGASIKWPA